MRDGILTIFILGGLAATLRYPFTGMLLWVWLAIMNPHQETYGFAHIVPWNLIIAIVTTASWLFSPNRKLPPGGWTTAAVLALLAWTTLNTFYAFDPAWSWPFWDRAWKTIAMCLLAAAFAVNLVRFHALMWTVALSLGYYGIKGGLFTLLTGGHSHVFGAPDSMIFDNNELALALVMVLPILNYLRLHSGSRPIRTCLVVAIVLVLASVLGSYSREAYIALAALILSFWFRTRNKLVYPVIAAAVLIPLLLFMPTSFFDRTGSILQYNKDASFQTRLDSWWVAWRYAMDHAPFGAGFYGMNLKGLWDRYIPGEMHAAHSIYFQVLGEQGIIGLVLYLFVIVLGFRNLGAVMRRAKAVRGLRWARDLAAAMQLSLISFCIGGAAAPMDFYDLLFLWVMLGAALLALTRQEETALAGAPSRTINFGTAACVQYPQRG